MHALIILLSPPDNNFDHFLLGFSERLNFLVDHRYEFLLNGLIFDSLGDQRIILSWTDGVGFKNI